MFKTNIPSYLRVLGKHIKVAINNTKVEMGTYGDETVELRPSYDDQELHDTTVLHELYHATLERIGAQLEHNLEEVLCETLAKVTAENFRITRRF